MATSNVGPLLAGWRRTRRLSQLDLAERAVVSSRHLSFVETGRARPSPGLLRRLAEELDLSCRQTNELLMAAGHSPVFGATQLDDPAMTPVREALQLMLESHLPYPAAVLDGHWNLLLANEAQQALINAVEAEGGPLPATTNIMELAFHPQGLRPFIVNWETVAGFLLRHLRRDLDLRPEPGLKRLYQRLSELADLPALLRHSPSTTAPMLTVQMRIDGQKLTTFSTLASFGTAMDVMMEELRIEQYFPADQSTRAFFHSRQQLVSDLRHRTVRHKHV